MKIYFICNKVVCKRLHTHVFFCVPGATKLQRRAAPPLLSPQQLLCFPEQTHGGAVCPQWAPRPLDGFAALQGQVCTVALPAPTFPPTCQHKREGPRIPAECGWRKGSAPSAHDSSSGCYPCPGQARTAWLALSPGLCSLPKPQVGAPRVQGALTPTLHPQGLSLPYPM